jgi:excisionase family DNA binding protein
VKSQAQRVAESDLFAPRNESAAPSPAAGHPDSVRANSPISQLEQEYFVDASIAAKYLNCSRKHILRLSRHGVIPAHPISFGRRVTWRYLLSELRAWVLGNSVPRPFAKNAESRSRMAGGSPRKGGR